jgi:hypothetical protein
MVDLITIAKNIPDKKFIVKINEINKINDDNITLV